MKFSGKTCLKIILKVTKNQGFTLSLEDIFFKNPQGGSNWHLPPPSRFRVKEITKTEQHQNITKDFLQDHIDKLIIDGKIANKIKRDKNSYKVNIESID